MEVCLGHLCNVYLRWNKCYLYSIPQTLTTPTPRLYPTSTINTTSRLSCPPKHASNRRNIYLEVETPLLLPCKVWVDLSTTRHDNRFEAPFLHWLAQVQDSHNFCEPRSLSTKKKLWVRFFTQIIPKKIVLFFITPCSWVHHNFEVQLAAKWQPSRRLFRPFFHNRYFQMCTLHCTHLYMRSHNGYHSPTINQNAKRWYFRSIPTTTLIKRGTNRESSFSWCLICIFFLKRLISILCEENGGLPRTSLIKRQTYQEYPYYFLYVEISDDLPRTTLIKRRIFVSVCLLIREVLGRHHIFVWLRTESTIYLCQSVFW